MSVDKSTINEFYKMFGKVNDPNYAMLDNSFVIYGQKNIRYMGESKNIMVSYVHGNLSEASKIPEVKESIIIYVSEPYKTEEADAIKKDIGTRIISTKQESIKDLLKLKDLFFE